MEDTEGRSLILLFLFLAGFMVRFYYIYEDVNVCEIDPGDCRDFRMAAENFFYTNKMVFRNHEGFSGTILVMGIVDKIFGPHRAIVQYCNALCFMLASCITYKLLKKLSDDFRFRIILIAWMIFTPQNIENTSVSNREGFISFFIALSIFFFLRFTENRKTANIFLSFLSLFMAALMHSGTIGLIIGYVFYLALYDKHAGKYILHGKSIVIFLIFVISFYFIYIQFGDILLSKISGIESVDDITNNNRSKGGAAYYVPGNGASSIIEMLFYTPIRAFYFLLSPTPWNWRGISDMIAFVACSVPQLLIGYLTITKIKYLNPKQKAVFVPLLVSAIAVAFIFGWTAGNAGTDIRHRDKFLSLYVCMLGILLNTRRIKEYEENCTHTALFR